jgi:hypothetical protein
MRKIVVIVGAVLLSAGIVIAVVGLFSATQSLGSPLGGFTGSLKNSATIAPGDNVSLGTTRPGIIALVAYQDNASAAIKLSAGSNSVVTRPTTRNGATVFVSAFSGLSNNSQPIFLVNNQSSALEVKYSFSESSLGSLAASGLSLLGGGLLFVVGLIVLIVGFVLKGRTPEPAQM